MLRIIICEDDKNCQAELQQIINHVLFDKIDVTIEKYDSGTALLEEWNRCGEINADLIFLDIQMPEINGLQLAKILRGNNIDTDIVFVTGHSEYVFRAYEIHAYDYLLKPITVGKMEEVLKRYIDERMADGQRYLYVNKKSQKLRIPLNRVYYFISDRRKIKAVMGNAYGEVEFYMKLEDLEEKLRDAGFVRCHQSYLVNSHKVLSWERTSIVLIGKEHVPISRKYIDIVNNVLNKGGNRNE